VVTDVGDPPVSLLVNHRLVRASRLQVVEADQLHVTHVGPLLRRRAVLSNEAEHAEDDPDHRRRPL
jgi:hypothetical protein